ncbi:MAG: type II toxin-antitoxin system RelE/ParE family toxin [Deltaproteobacteria bacterium]|nr:type II toxin-antitoxin system RelE/ParE family toxin [Deltaproteobacteria bacterium]
MTRRLAMEPTTPDGPWHTLLRESLEQADYRALLVETDGEGVFECRIDFGPGYRIYFGKEEDTLIILLGGGTKKRQQRDIENARMMWKEYKERKRQEG